MTVRNDSAERSYLLTYKEAGKRLAVSAATIKRLVKARKISAVYPLSRPRIAAAEIDRYIQIISTPKVLHLAARPIKSGKISRQQAAELLR